MHCKNIFLDDGCYGEEVKQISEQLPYSCVAVFILTFHIEAVILSDRSEFMISSDEYYFIRVFEFEEAEESDGFHAVSTSIYIISEE